MIKQAKISIVYSDMRNTQLHSHRQYSNVKSLLYTAIVALLTTILVPACQHEPVNPVDPGTGNPIDTTGNNNGGNNGGNNGTPCDNNVVYFNMQVLPLLQSNCAKSGCHDAITHEEGIILDSYQNVMNSDVVDAFDLDDSDLYEAITEDDHDKRMPPPPNQPLSSQQIALIANWILQGAKNETCDNGGTGCDTENVTYSGFVAPLLTTYCVGCHSGPAASGGIVLNNYNNVRSVAQSGRLHGAISWAPGFQRMPQGGAQLPQCSIDKIKAWIDDGALNN